MPYLGWKKANYPLHLYKIWLKYLLLCYKTQLIMVDFVTLRKYFISMNIKNTISDAMKQHRNELHGEHRFGDAGQLLLCIIFFVVWALDSFRYHCSVIDLPLPLYLKITLAVLVAAAGGVLAYNGMFLVFGTVREKPVLIREGVFKIVRHPIYLGAILLYVIPLLLFFSIIASGIWVIIFLFYIFLCKYEEGLLTEQYPEEYKNYIRDVPMLLPIRFKRK